MEFDEIKMSIPNLIKYAATMEELGVQIALAAVMSESINSIFIEDASSSISEVAYYHGLSGNKLETYFTSLTLHLNKLSTLLSVGNEFISRCIEKMADTDTQIYEILQSHTGIQTVGTPFP